MIVGADGINSRVREAYKDHFKPSLELKANKFAWLGSTRPLDAFTYFFKQTDHGLICAHTYQYEPGGSTWLFEMEPDAWAAFGFDRLNEAESARLLEKIFAAELEGHRLVTNRSLWRNFPRVVLRDLVAQEHRAARRCEGDRAFLDRLGHQARDGMRDRALRRAGRARRAFGRGRLSRL